jgi:putative transposase
VLSRPRLQRGCQGIASVTRVYYIGIMPGDRYIIRDQNAVYFFTFTVVDWVDIFTRPEYKMIIVDSLNYCIEHKGLVCYGWVLMSNHLHLIVKAEASFRISDTIRDFKKFTSKKIIDTVLAINESRREWLLHRFAFAARSTGRAEHYKVWRDDNHAVTLEGAMFEERLNYMHENPVKAMIVFRAEDYLFSSAADYSGSTQGLVKLKMF